MSLVAITDFDAELRLLGLYEREVMRTGILDYHAQWPLPPSISPETPPNVDVQPLLALPEPTTPVVTTQDNAPAVETCSDSAIAADHAVNHIEVNIQADGLVEAQSPTPVVADTTTDFQTIAPLPCPLEARRKALLTEQEEERRLFYLFVEELERTVDLRKLPAILQPTSRS